MCRNQGDIRTACWLERQSQTPSQARMKKRSPSCSSVSVMSGSAVIIYSGERGGREGLRLCNAWLLGEDRSMLYEYSVSIVLRIYLFFS